jgi:hypothetical protein
MPCRRYRANEKDKAVIKIGKDVQSPDMALMARGERYKEPVALAA